MIFRPNGVRRGFLGNLRLTGVQASGNRSGTGWHCAAKVE
jgi:hypothetical protein